MILFFIVSMIILLFVTIIWFFKTHFIVIYNMQAWPAMEASRKLVMKNFGSVLGLVIVLGLIVLVSAIPCGIGLLFSYPLMIGASYSAFAQLTHCHESNELQADNFDFMKDEPTA